MLKKVFKYGLLLLATYVFICFITPYNKSLRNRSIRNQINYLSKALDNGGDDEIQLRFPEGKLFSNCLLALSVIDFTQKNANANKKYAIIVDNCIRRIQSKQALATFDPGLIPSYGMFYQAWSNLVYSTYLDSDLINYSNISELVFEASAAYESTMQQVQADSLRILDTYNGLNWPADNLIGVSSLRNDSLRMLWIELLMNTTEHPGGLIHHSGDQKHTIRGSSSAMIAYCLHKSAYSGVEEYNDRFNEIFVDNYMGIQLVRENEDGSNEMDEDSGPVLLGYGASATIMNIKTQARLDKPQAKITWAAMNVISLPINLFGHKFLLFKKEPMLDLFMLWTSVEL